jgi:structural maintenance of chromosome 3 (chondroitin sulfate proteoglycan 6)
MLEIELSDDLRRRREDLKSLLESRGEDGVGGDAVGADTDARRERLRNLEQSIDQLQGVIECKWDRSCLVV